MKLRFIQTPERLQQITTFKFSKTCFIIFEESGKILFMNDENTSKNIYRYNFDMFQSMTVPKFHQIDQKIQLFHEKVINTSVTNNIYRLNLRPFTDLMHHAIAIKIMQSPSNFVRTNANFAYVALRCIFLCKFKIYVSYKY